MGKGVGKALRKAVKRGRVKHSTSDFHIEGASTTIKSTTSVSPKKGYTRHETRTFRTPTHESTSFETNKVKIGKTPKLPASNAKHRYDTPKENKNRKNWPSNFIPGVNTHHRSTNVGLEDRPFSHRNTTYVHPATIAGGVGSAGVGAAGIHHLTKVSGSNPNKPTRKGR